MWGPMDANGGKTVDDIYEQLCMFDEHTWGHINSVAMPWSLEVLAQYNEKSRLAYRPFAQAQLLLSQRIRTGLLRRRKVVHRQRFGIALERLVECRHLERGWSRSTSEPARSVELAMVAVEKVMLRSDWATGPTACQNPFLYTLFALP